jgi:hypothetical protein
MEGPLFLKNLAVVYIVHAITGFLFYNFFTLTRNSIGEQSLLHRYCHFFLNKQQASSDLTNIYSYICCLTS